MRTFFGLMVLVFGISGATAVQAGQVLAPTIVSPITAVGQVNAAFEFRIVATGDAPISYAASGLPEGLAVSGDGITGTPTEFGSFVVTLTASNLVGSDTETLTLDIQPLAAGSGSLSNTDRDGDGYSDELEIALNSSPAKQSSKPLSGPVAAPAGALTVERLAIRLNFVSDRRDSLTCRGRVVVSDNALRAGDVFVLDVAGIIQSTSLDSRGKGIQSEDEIYTFTLRLPRTGVTGVTRVGRFSLAIRKRNFFNQLTDEGLTKTVSGTYTLPVTAIFDGKIYRTTVQQVYTVRANKSGSTK